MNVTGVFMPETADLPPLPLGHLGFERIGRQCHEAPHLKPLAFEALLHTPLALVIEDPAATADVSKEGWLQTPPLLIQLADSGIPQSLHAVFSDLEHFRVFMPERYFHGVSVPVGSHLIAPMLADSRYPIVVDPRTSHSVVFGYDEMRAWLLAWHQFQLVHCPLPPGDYEYEQAPCLPQCLLDRLSAYLTSWPADIKRAYVVRMCSSEKPHTGFKLALAIECGSDVVAARVLRALPLLNWGVEDMEQRLLDVLLLNRYPELMPKFAAALSPVYDRAMSPWLTPRRAGGH